MLDFINIDTDILLVAILVINIILIIMVIINSVRVRKIKKNSTEFMKKLGNGKDIGEILEKYMDRVVDLEAGLSEANVYCKQLDSKIQNCVQKVGIVRYNAYKDAGSDLSFAVALLDNKNNGVVLNGIYSREMSNIYAKPIINGSSKYTMTEEENEALSKAVSLDR